MGVPAAVLVLSLSEAARAAPGSWQRRNSGRAATLRLNGRRWRSPRPTRTPSAGPHQAATRRVPRAVAAAVATRARRRRARWS